MHLARLVETVEQVRATSKKSDKIRILADTLRATQGHETVLTALYLSGSLPQGRIGIGWSFIQQALGEVPGVLGSARSCLPSPWCSRPWSPVALRCGL